MSVWVAVILMGMMVPMILAFGWFVTHGGAAKTFAIVASWFESPKAVTAQPEEDLQVLYYQTKERRRKLEHQDWAETFRKLNKGKPWDYKPRIGPPPTRKPLRSTVDPDGEIIEVNSWQSMIDEEVICNPCARGMHERCVVFDDAVDDICFCDCLMEDEDV